MLYGPFYNSSNSSAENKYCYIDIYIYYGEQICLGLTVRPERVFFSWRQSVGVFICFMDVCVVTVYCLFPIGRYLFSYVLFQVIYIYNDWFCFSVYILYSKSDIFLMTL
jgi:hypothetical protein